MKKIAYIIYWNSQLESGVFKKVINSVITWNNYGIESKLFVLTSNKKIYDSKIVYTEFFLFNSYLSKVNSYKNLLKKVNQFCPDVIYYRFHTFIPGFKKLSNKIPLIIEVNTNDIIEKKINSKIGYIYNILTRDKIFKRSNGIVFVSSELENLKIFTKFKKPSITLGNGINTEKIPKLKPTNNENPNIVFIAGSNHPWQGIDKVILLAKLFPKFYFHIIGVKREDINFSSNIKNIRFYGFLTFNEYKEIISKCDCAIGTLALHRKNMSTTSALKVIEYLSFGLPIIIAYNDINIPDNLPYVLKIENKENNIIPNKNKIEKFIYKWKNKRINSNIINKFDINYIEKKRIEFFKLIKTHDNN